MTRRVGLHLYITLDGYTDFPTYPGFDYPPPTEPDLINAEMGIKRWDSIDTLLFDPQTFGEWADFWPLDQRTPEEHPGFRPMAEFAERVQKIVLGDGPEPPGWTHTRGMPGDPAERLRQLRSEPGQNMAVVAPGLGPALMQAGLLDDYCFAVFPVILGQGRLLFGRLAHQQTLRLVEVKSFRFGELFRRYETIR